MICSDLSSKVQTKLPNKAEFKACQIPSSLKALKALLDTLKLESFQDFQAARRIATYWRSIFVKLSCAKDRTF